VSLETCPRRPFDAVLLDAFGTLIDVHEPARRLRRTLLERIGVAVTEEAAAEAFAAEAGYYAAHCHEGSDGARLADLYRRCAAVILDRLGIDRDPAEAVAALRESIAFVAYPDAAPTIAGIAGAGLKLAVVSNADCSLPSMLREAGLEITPVFDSASTGSSKPDPEIFHRALRSLGTSAERTLHVGDTPAADGAGARAAGVHVRILDRSGGGGTGTISALTDLLPLIGAPA